MTATSVKGFVMAFTLGASLLSAQAFTPAEWQSGAIPSLSPLSIEVGGGQVIAEVTVDRSGKVADVKTLRDTKTFTERVLGLAQNWTFKPARRTLDPAALKPGEPTEETVQSKVLVAAVFRPPTMIGPTFGEPIQDVAKPSDDVPYPTSLVTPLYPPTALNPGVVLVEVRVDRSGAVTGATTRLSAPPFDGPATDAALQWKFRPAHVDGAPRASLVYIIFGFQVPTT